MWVERQMERCDKTNSHFCNSANTPENYEKLVRKINIMVMSHIKATALTLDPT